MDVKYKKVFQATQFNKFEDHRDAYRWSVSVPILDEEPGEENKWPVTGRLASTEECKPEHIRYSIKAPFQTGLRQFLLIELGDWVLESEGRVVNVITNKDINELMDVV